MSEKNAYKQNDDILRLTIIAILMAISFSVVINFDEIDFVNEGIKTTVSFICTVVVGVMGFFFILYMISLGINKMYLTKHKWKIHAFIYDFSIAYIASLSLAVATGSIGLMLDNDFSTKPIFFYSFMFIGIILSLLLFNKLFMKTFLYYMKKDRKIKLN